MGRARLLADCGLVRKGCWCPLQAAVSMRNTDDASTNKCVVSRQMQHGSWKRAET